ncbi:NAD(P)-dependent oxidoreductase [Streptosporangium sp. NPDC002544]|uniref:NAD(P)-dependent oxidoreductase n=1 Tax=Streptosporangium sp. NPDC002544 TaxID=3154538 RepID=UPI003320DF91
MRVAVLGMGMMGRALARRLLGLGFQVTVWNRTPGRADEPVSLGAVEAASLGEAVRAADAVLLSLADGRAVREVMAQLVQAGPIESTRPVVADLSTVAPATAREMRDLVPGGRFVAAPVLGGPSAVAEGKATVLVGGERDLVDELKPVWTEAFASYSYCGADPGAALAFKLLNNYLLMSGIAALAEVTATSQAAGLDNVLLHDFLFQWPTVAPALHNRIDDVLASDHQGWFTTRLAAKDVRLAAELAESSGLELPVARLVERRYEEAAERGWGDADIGAIVELLRGGSR